MENVEFFLCVCCVFYYYFGWKIAIKFVRAEQISIICNRYFILFFLFQNISPCQTPIFFWLYILLLAIFIFIYFPTNGWVFIYHFIQQYLTKLKSSSSSSHFNLLPQVLRHRCINFSSQITNSLLYRTVIYLFIYLI